MQKVERTVFLSYRRTNAAWALAIYKSLSEHGFDVFFDYESIASGAFEEKILRNIRARAHFVVLLTPSALDRCSNPSDLFRREIEAAMQSRRNIVPVTLEGFDFSHPGVDGKLNGDLRVLREYNALRVPADFFDEAMHRLRTKYLDLPLEAVLHPLPAELLKATQEGQRQADGLPTPNQTELLADEWFERAITATDLSEKSFAYSEAIRLNPRHAAAHYNRARQKQLSGALAAALIDYNEAIRLSPNDPDSYINRCLVRRELGDLTGAIADGSIAIRLSPADPNAFVNRGTARGEAGDLAGALEDLDRAVELSPPDADIHYCRGLAHHKLGNQAQAIAEYTRAISLNPRYADAYLNRSQIYFALLRLPSALKDVAEYKRLSP